jgi:competence protein ComEA
VSGQHAARTPQPPDLEPTAEEKTMNSHRRLVAAALALALLAPLAALAAEAAPKGVINVNTASAEQLQLLPRIGPAVAERIVEQRTASGKFGRLEDLMLVRGIGERTFEQMKPYLTLSGESTLKEKVRVPRTGTEAEGEER